MRRWAGDSPRSGIRPKEEQIRKSGLDSGMGRKDSLCITLISRMLHSVYLVQLLLLGSPVLSHSAQDARKHSALDAPLVRPSVRQNCAADLTSHEEHAIGPFGGRARRKRPPATRFSGKPRRAT
jgi:hypothetical protein